MSKAMLPRPVPVGLLVAARPRPEPQRSHSRSSARWLWPAAAVAWLGFLGLASAGLTAIALRPVLQTVTEVAYVPPPAPPPVVVEPDPPVLPGESRPPLPGMPAETPSEPTPAPAPQPAPLDPAAAAPCGRFGTAIDFVRSPAIAFDRAARERKLVLVVHLAGHFEDPGFT
jgi:hypothetical protein